MDSPCCMLNYQWNIPERSIRIARRVLPPGPTDFFYIFPFYVLFYGHTIPPIIINCFFWKVNWKEFFLWIFLFCTKNNLIKRRTFGGGGSGLGGGETDPAAHGHKKTEQSDGLSRFCFKDELHPSPPLLQKWHPHRDSNPSCRDENPVS